LKQPFGTVPDNHEAIIEQLTAFAIGGVYVMVTHEF
jgi:hypothetical protein